MGKNKENIFLQVFGRKAEVVSSAPGRINLIGEHTDYNNGYVLPAAIHLRNYFWASGRKDRKVHLRTANFQEEVTFSLDHLIPARERKWPDYIKGIFWVLKKHGFESGGVDAFIWGEVPLEAGLSSSAALEVSVLCGLVELFGILLPSRRLAVLAQEAENEFVGLKCGLMDQFIAVFGEKNKAIFLDCETLDFEPYPLNLERAGLGILVCDTKVARNLSTSQYNKRREEAHRALEFLKEHGVPSYKKATVTLLQRNRHTMDDVLYRRAKHVISENERVKEAVQALQRDDFRRLGELLFRSHESLRDDYEVSSPELDLLYETGKEIQGCYGARLVGAGFGGSGIALLELSRMEDFKQKMLEKSRRRGFPKPEFHQVSVGEGAAVHRLAV